MKKRELLPLGQPVRVIANDSGHDFKIGTKGKITDIFDGDSPHYTVSDGKDHWYLTLSELELISNEELVKMNNLNEAYDVVKTHGEGVYHLTHNKTPSTSLRLLKEDICPDEGKNIFNHTLADFCMDNILALSWDDIYLKINYNKEEFIIQLVEERVSFNQKS